MKLKLENLTSGSSEVQREFESMGKGLVLIRISASPKNSSPLHWRLVDGRKPPLDIAVHPFSGAFNSLKFFLMDEKLGLFQSDFTKVQFKAGLPIFDTSIWTEDTSIVDMEGSFSANTNGTQVVILFGEDQITDGIALTDSTYLLFNKDKECKGVLLNDLSENELDALKESNAI